MNNYKIALIATRLSDGKKSMLYMDDSALTNPIVMRRYVQVVRERCND